MRPKGQSNNHEEFFTSLHYGDKFYMVENEGADMRSFWFVGFSPVSLRSVVAINSESERKATVININNDAHHLTTFTLTEEAASEAYVREAQRRADSIKKYFGPESQNQTEKP